MKADAAVLEGYELLGDVNITLQAELDHRTFTFEKLINMQVGSILELGRPTGENVEIYAEDVLLGTGEILIVDATLAIRFADLRSFPSVAKKAAD